MKSPVSNGEVWFELAEVASTQTTAAKLLKEDPTAGVVFARRQTHGKGRFDRKWFSTEGDSLTFSLIFRAYAGHPKPHLIGMAAALAAAAHLHCELKWPNDLIVQGLKLGGILTELVPDDKGRLVPIVGIGVNLNQTEFPPEIKEFATSLSLAHGGHFDGEMVAHRIVSRLDDLPEPNSWPDLQPIWSLFDSTPGKKYRLASGEDALALGIGSEGQLLCSVNGETRSVLAAEALFG